MPFLQYGDHVFNCSFDKEHKPDCPGDCGVIKPTNNQIDLNNEVEQWNRRNMLIIGIPDVLMGKIPSPGFPINILDMSQKFESLMKFLIQKEIINEQEYLDFHKGEFAKFLKENREATQDKPAIETFPNLDGIKRIH
jgi:hypothetical protein